MNYIIRTLSSSHDCYFWLPSLSSRNLPDPLFFFVVLILVHWHLSHIDSNEVQWANYGNHVALRLFLLRDFLEFSLFFQISPFRKSSLRILTFKFVYWNPYKTFHFLIPLLAFFRDKEFIVSFFRETGDWS